MTTFRLFISQIIVRNFFQETEKIVKFQDQLTSREL